MNAEGDHGEEEQQRGLEDRLDVPDRVGLAAHGDQDQEKEDVRRHQTGDAETQVEMDLVDDEEQLKNSSAFSTSAPARAGPRRDSAAPTAPATPSTIRFRRSRPGAGEWLVEVVARGRRSHEAALAKRAAARTGRRRAAPAARETTAPSGMPKPCFGLSRTSRGSQRAATRRSRCLPRPPRHAERRRQPRPRRRQAMVEKRRAPLERVGHRHAVELHQDVVRKVAGEVDRDTAIERAERAGGARGASEAAVVSGAVRADGVAEEPSATSARVSATPLR